jgi:hypothetical protein
MVFPDFVTVTKTRGQTWSARRLFESRRDRCRVGRSVRPEVPEPCVEYRVDGSPWVPVQAPSPIPELLSDSWRVGFGAGGKVSLSDTVSYRLLPGNVLGLEFVLSDGSRVQFRRGCSAGAGAVRLNGRLEVELGVGERRSRKEFRSATLRGLTGPQSVTPDVPLFGDGSGKPAFEAPIMPVMSS